ncbi:MAG: sterol desaturase family protein [Rhizomicrobium sp.]
MPLHALIQIAHLVDWQGLLLFAAVCVPVELLLPMHRRGLVRKGWTTDAFYLVVNGLFVRLGLSVLLITLVAALKALVPHGLPAFIAAQPLWLQIAGAVLIGDFALYWAHRALHTNRLLWRFHAIHHAIEELDWVAAYHAHPIDDVVLAGASIGSVTVLGFSPEAIAGYVAIYSYMSAAVHVNTRLKTGPLRWVFGSPEFHHWHHSNERDARDHNFASIISFWDVLFGTVFLPRNRVPQVYGISDPMPSGYVDQLIHPFRRKAAESAGTAAIAPAP